MECRYKSGGNDCQNSSFAGESGFVVHKKLPVEWLYRLNKTWCCKTGPYAALLKSCCFVFSVHHNFFTQITDCSTIHTTSASCIVESLFFSCNVASEPGIYLFVNHMHWNCGLLVYWLIIPIVLSLYLLLWTLHFIVYRFIVCFH